MFTDSNGVTEAAFAGMGMALLRRSFWRLRWPQGGWLISGGPSACPLAYHLVYHETALLAPANRCFLRLALAGAGAVAEARVVGALSDKDPYA
ncbi:hypothetical protein MJ579_12165 [Klebsiella pneumoniae]|nr:hypothetical protein MJ579_12165 [Klebsiella pneumoniae]